MFAGFAAQLTERSGVVLYACHRHARAVATEGSGSKGFRTPILCAASTLTKCGSTCDFSDDFAFGKASKQCLLDRFRKLPAGQNVLTSGIIRKHLRNVVDHGLYCVN